MSVPTTYQDDGLNHSFDWDLLVTSRLNAILCGDRATLDVTLSILAPHLELPLHRWSSADAAPLPPLAYGTVLVTDLAGATLAQQRVLLEWIDAHPAIRVITVSEHPMFEMVKEGTLLERLYYRLNPMYCTLSPQCSSQSADLGRTSAA